MSPVLGTIQKSVGLVPCSVPVKVRVNRVCSTVTAWPPTTMVASPSASPARATFSAGLASEHMTPQRSPGCAAGGSR